MVWEELADVGRDEGQEVEFSQEGEGGGGDAEGGASEEGCGGEGFALASGQGTAGEQGTGEQERQEPAPGGREAVAEHPHGEQGGDDGEPGGAGEDGLEGGDAAGIDDPMILLGEEASVDDLEGVAFLVGDDALAGPAFGLAGVFADGATEQVFVEFGFETDGLADQEAAEFGHQVGGGGAVVGIPGEAGEADGLEIIRDSDGDIAEERGWGGGDGFEDLGDGWSGEGGVAGEHLEHETAEGEDVGGGGEGAAEDLFWGGVEGGAFEAASLAAGFIEREGQAEVEDPGAEVGADDDVVGFEVAVDEVVGVGGGEAAGDLPEEARLLDRFELGGEAVDGEALDPFHDDGGRVGVIEDGVDGHDGGVTEGGGLAGLVEEPASEGFVVAGAQHLDRDAAVEFKVVGGVDDAEAAGSESAIDAVAGQGGWGEFGIGAGGGWGWMKVAEAQARADPFLGLEANVGGEAGDVGADVGIVREGGGSEEGVGEGGGVGWIRLRERGGDVCGRGGGGGEEVAGLVVGPEEGLDLVEEGGMAVAAGSDPAIAVGTGWMLQGFGEDRF